MSEGYWGRFWRGVFRPAGSHMTARVLTKMLLASLRLQPIAILAQFAGMTSLTAVFWNSDLSRLFLVIWYCFGMAQIALSVRFLRYFWRDRNRVARIRLWIRRWTALAVAAGVIWGVAGPSMMLPLSGISQVVTVAVVVAVTFASWPVYSCWLPSLTAFTLLSLTPMMITFAVQFSISQALMVLVLVVSSGFILYSGRKLNEMVMSSILTDDKNQRLVDRLKNEINRAERARRQAEAISERRSRFFAAANHDIRQPLQAMGIYLDLLRRRASAQQKPIVDQLIHTSESISTLVESVLTVTRMEFGRLDMHPETIEVPGFLTELANECRPIAEKKGLRLRVVADVATVNTDPLLFKRAIKNLVSNAIVYSRPEAPVPEIVLAARVRQDTLTVAVYDCGPGLSNDDKERIFHTFFRGSAGKQNPGGGFGLGLSIVKGIATQLGATLTVASRLGRGSVFRFALPLHRQALPAKAQTPELESEKGNFTWPKRVVLLDDNTLVAQAVGALLEGHGVEVTTFTSPSHLMANEAYPTLFSDVDVLITDFNLGEGELDGLEVASAVYSELAQTDHQPDMVLLTAVSRDLIETRWHELIAQGDTNGMAFPTVLQKPVSDASLARALQAANERT